MKWIERNADKIFLVFILLYAAIVVYGIYVLSIGIADVIWYPFKWVYGLFSSSSNNGNTTATGTQTQQQTPVESATIGSSAPSFDSDYA